MVRHELNDCRMMLLNLDGDDDAYLADNYADSVVWFYDEMRMTGFLESYDLIW